MLTITNKLLIEEAQKAGIEHKIISDKHNLVLFSYKEDTALVRRSRISQTSCVFSYISEYKEATYDVLDYYGFSYPKGIVVNSMKEAEEFADKIGYPLVIKPELGGHGDGVTADIQNFDELSDAYLEAQKINPDDIIIQKFIPGDDYRIMVVGYKVVAIAKRIPTRVFGNGKLTIKQLIEKENKNPLRAEGHQAPMTLIKTDHEVERVLDDQNLTLESIPENQQEIRLRKNANLSTGGEAEDYTADVPSENIQLFEKIAQVLDANVVGIDVRCYDITKNLFPQDYSVIEVNASPGIRMHHFPSKGKPKNVAKEIMKVLFPKVYENVK